MHPVDDGPELIGMSSGSVAGFISEWWARRGATTLLVLTGMESTKQVCMSRKRQNGWMGIHGGNRRAEVRGWLKKLTGGSDKERIRKRIPILG